MIREVNLAVEVLKAGSLAKLNELVVDEAILDVVELVDVIHNCLTLILHKMLMMILLLFLQKQNLAFDVYLLG